MELHLESFPLVPLIEEMAKTIEPMGVHAGKILKGATPANLSVELPTAFDLAINLKTAKTLGIEVRQRCWRAPTR